VFLLECTHYTAQRFLTPVLAVQYLLLQGAILYDTNRIYAARYTQNFPKILICVCSHEVFFQGTDVIRFSAVSALTRRFLSREKASATPALSPEEVWKLRKKERREIRMLEREVKKFEAKARVCYICGFGPLKGVAYSYLVRTKDQDGNVVFGHASPAVCAGAVGAITSQARESFKETFSDLLRLAWKGITRFLKEDSSHA